MHDENTYNQKNYENETTSYQRNYIYDDDKNKEYYKILYARNNGYQVIPRFNPNNYQCHYQPTSIQQNYQRLQNPSNSNWRNQKAPPPKKNTSKIGRNPFDNQNEMFLIKQTNKTHKNSNI